MTVFFDPGSILEPTLVKAAISETQFPVARATRNGDFMRRRCGVARWLRNSGCSSMERTLLGFHAGISFFGGGGSGGTDFWPGGRTLCRRCRHRSR